MSDLKITIHFNFTDGSELSYWEGKNSTEDFTTNCLEFFSTKNKNAVVRLEDGRSISVRDLLGNNGRYCEREIRESHDLRKMLVAGCFEWRHIK